MPLEVFYSYSHKDEDLRNELDTHLSQLVRSGLIAAWHDRKIGAGAEWRDEIDAHIHSAHIILLLVSPDFLASEYCYGVEMKTALERHENEHAIVIPIILRPVDWSGAPFAHLQALPRDAKAVTLWPNRDQAFAEIAQSIREIAVRFQRPAPEKPTPTTIEDQAVAKPRVLDAAMPGHIVKDRATELLVLIRLPESAGLAGALQADDEAEARPEDVRSRPFDITFPLDPTGRPEALKVAIEVTSPDFSPQQQRKNLFVPVNADSDVCPFLLTPIRTGQLTVVVELQWQDAQRGYRRLRTDCVAQAEEPATKPVMNVVQMPIVVGQRDEKLAERLAPAVALPAPVRRSSVLTSPAVKAAAAAVFLISIGGLYFTQRNAWPPPILNTATKPTPPPPRPDPTTEEKAAQRPQLKPDPVKPVSALLASRVVASVSGEALDCREKISKFAIFIPDAEKLASNHPGVVPGIELRRVTALGDVGYRNVRFDAKTGKLSGEVYAKAANCSHPQRAVATYSVVAFYR